MSLNKTDKKYFENLISKHSEYILESNKVITEAANEYSDDPTKMPSKLGGLLSSMSFQGYQKLAEIKALRDAYLYLFGEAIQIDVEVEELLNQIDYMYYVKDGKVYLENEPVSLWIKQAKEAE